MPARRFSACSRQPQRKQTNLFIEAINCEDLQYISVLQLSAVTPKKFSLKARRNMSALTKVFALLALCLIHTSSGIFFKSKPLYKGFTKVDKSKLLHNGYIKPDSFPRYTWTGTNVRFPTDDVRHEYVDNNKFIMQNSIQTRFQVLISSTKNVHEIIPITSILQVQPISKMVLMTMPRYYEATPITLALADFSAGPTAPSFFAYPNWEMQEVGNPNAIQSAVDLFIDPKVIYIQRECCKNH
jgi:hypothetical protein